jgi:hypothetical protein
MASLVVTLLAFTFQPELSLAGQRSIFTLLGAALAPHRLCGVAYVAATYLRGRLAGLVAIRGQYGQAVLRSWADPVTADRQSLLRSMPPLAWCRSTLRTLQLNRSTVR